MIDSIQGTQPWTANSPPARGAEPTGATLLAGVVTAAVGWAILLPVGVFSLVAIPFVATHPSKVVHFTGSAYLVLPLVLGALCVRLGPRVVDRVASRLWAALVVGAIGIALIAVSAAAGHVLWHGWLTYTSSLRRYVRVTAGFSGLVALTVPALLATPSAGRDFAFSREARSIGGHDPRLPGAVRVTACAVGTVFVMGVLGVAGRR